ncbi:MAG: hypothetical protein RJB34_1221 [Pseudomonadota bacterium]|jgi:ABC-type uncharacterized transport system permease subunit
MILASTPTHALPFAVVLAYAAWAWGQPRLSTGLSRWALLLVGLLHLTALHQLFTAEPPAFGFALALSVTVWWVFCVFALETRLHTQAALRWTVAGLGAGAVLLAEQLPGTIHPHLSSPWLPLHWALGFAAYGLIAAAVAHAMWLQRTERRIRQGKADADGMPLLTLERMTFRFVGMGFVLLSATVLAGGVFSAGMETSLVWSHKTLFTLLSWVTMGVLLWGRWRWGWRGRLAVRTLYVAAGLLLLGYVGSRFVLEVLLQRLS